MKRIQIAAAALLLLAGPASAGAPNNQACLGNDFSGYASADGSGFGLFVASLAWFAGGLGLPINLHLAGLISDSSVPNSCND